MTDKELLEFAAKADGRSVIRPDVWNPLTNNSDAFQLAVKLTISIEFDDYEYVRIGGVHYADTSISSVCRAIVLAAAEIGKESYEIAETQYREDLIAKTKRIEELEGAGRTALYNEIKSRTT